jgi:hypothetical protein
MMPVKKYRKKPVIIDAVQFDGENSAEIASWMNENKGRAVVTTAGISIHTLEGWMLAVTDDWVIRGVKGEFYPCKPDIFDATYEEVV